MNSAASWDNLCDSSASNAEPFGSPARALGAFLEMLGELPRCLIARERRPAPPRDVKTLAGDRDCLHRIVHPGVYALTTPLHAQPNKAGLIIAADNVELRLCGCELVGCRGSRDAIVVRGRNCTIRDGAIRDWGHSGVDAMRAVRCRLENMHCFHNGLYGILLGKQGEAIGCSVSENGGPGMETDAACTIVNCAAQGNWQRGFIRGSDSVSFGLISSVNNVSRSVDGAHA